MMRVLLTALWTCLIGTVWSQFGFVYHDSIVVKFGGDTLALPWTGGFNHAQFSSFDFDFDGEEDLFIFDRSANQIRVLLRKFDSTGNPHYEYIHGVRDKFPEQLL